MHCTVMCVVSACLLVCIVACFIGFWGSVILVEVHPYMTGFLHFLAKCFIRDYDVPLHNHISKICILLDLLKGGTV